jgi:hypothetical protein
MFGYMLMSKMMKKIKLCFITFHLLLLCIHCTNNNVGNSKYQKNTSRKNINSDRRCSQINQLIDLGSNFKPTDLDFSLSLKNDRKLNLFLDTIDEKCLLNQNNYKLFIALILVKQYHFHLSQAHQGYDLLSMSVGNASKIIHCFRVMTNKQSRMEMLNSGFIESYLMENPQIRNAEINTYMKNIKNMSDSIKMEAYW